MCVCQPNSGPSGSESHERDLSKLALNLIPKDLSSSNCESVGAIYVTHTAIYVTCDAIYVTFHAIYVRRRSQTLADQQLRVCQPAPLGAGGLADFLARKITRRMVISNITRLIVIFNITRLDVISSNTRLLVS